MPRNRPRMLPDIDGLAETFRIRAKQGGIDIASFAVGAAFTGLCRKWKGPR